MSKVNIVLDATMLDTFQTCACKFNYRHNLNKVTPDKATPLDRGSLVHDGNEAYYNALKSGEGWINAVQLAREAVQIKSKESNLEPAAISRIIDVLEEHYDYWKITDLNYEILAVEQPFMYCLHETDLYRIMMIGKIDLLVNDYQQNHHYENLVIDHKSYDREYPVRERTNQFLNYVNASGSNYLVVNKIGFQTSIPVEKKMKRIPLSYNDLMLEQWRANVIKWVELYMECVAEGVWPMNDTSCTKFNKICEYDEVCNSSGIEAKMYKLEMNFNTAEPWDVSKSLGLDKGKENDKVL